MQKRTGFGSTISCNWIWPYFWEKLDHWDLKKSHQKLQPDSLTTKSSKVYVTAPLKTLDQCPS